MRLVSTVIRRATLFDSLDLYLEDFYFEFSKTKQSLDSSPKSCPFDLELSLWPAFWGKSLTKYACIHDLQTRTY